MTRLALIVGLLVAAMSAAAVLLTDSDRPSDASVRVVFDTAKGIVPGQFVKIAGARVGQVDDVALTPENRARLELRIAAEHAAFRSDATCRILPEGPISESYVDCDPGTPGRPPLAPDADGTPSIPVEQTTVPVSIQDLLNVFAAPTETRLRLLLNELGIATMARGEDINDILRRSNPALEQADAVLSQVSRHTDELGASIRQTDRVLEQVARRDRDVRSFVTAAAKVADVTAQRRGELSATARRLPALLTSARGSLRAIDRATTAGAPLLASLRRSGPALTALMPKLSQIADDGAPALRSLGTASREARRTVEAATPLTKDLADMARSAGPFIDDLKHFLVSSRDKGAIENTMSFFYTLATVSALYDGESHLLTASLGVQAQCLLEALEIPGCSHAFNAPGNGQVPINDPALRSTQQRMLRDALAALTDRPAAPAPTPRKAPTVDAEPGQREPEATPPAAPSPPDRPGLPSGLDALTEGLRDLLRPQEKTPPVDVSSLLDFLLR